MRRGGEVAGKNHDPPQAPVEGVAMPVNPGGFTDAKVQGISRPYGTNHHSTRQGQTDQVNRQNVQRENPSVRRLADRQRDLTMLNPPIFTQSKTLENSHEFVDKVHNILVAMGATNIEKVELASYQLTVVAQNL